MEGRGKESKSGVQYPVWWNGVCGEAVGSSPEGCRGLEAEPVMESGVRSRASCWEKRLVRLKWRLGLAGDPGSGPLEPRRGCTSQGLRTAQHGTAGTSVLGCPGPGPRIRGPEPPSAQSGWAGRARGLRDGTACRWAGGGR